MIFDFAGQECRRFKQEPFRLLLLIAPWIALAISLLVYSARVVREVPTGVVDQDQSVLSRSLIRDFDACPQIRVQSFNTPSEMQQAFREGKIRGGISLPEGIGRQVREGKTARVVVWRDASNPLYSNQVYQAVSGVVVTEGAKLEAGRLVAAGVSFSASKDLTLLMRIDSRPLGNPFVDYLRNMAPGLLPVFLQLCLMLAGGNLLPHHWRNSVSPRRELIGRAIPWLVTQTAFAMLFFGVLYPCWGIPFEAPWAIFALVVLLHVASIAFGAMLARLLDNPLKTAQNLLAFNTPALLFSGYTFPEWAMPHALEVATRPLPFSLFMDAYRGATGLMGGRVEWGWIGLGLYVILSIGLLMIPPIRKFEDKPAPEPFHAKNELQRIFKTPGLVMLVIVAPIGYLAVYGTLFALKEEAEIPLAITGVVDSAVERNLVRALDAHPKIKVLMLQGDEAQYALEHGEVRGILELPDNLETQILRRHAVSIPMLIPANRFLPVSDLQRSANEVLMDFNFTFRLEVFQNKGVGRIQAKQRAEALVLEDHPLFNPRETYGDFMLPGLGVLILHQLMMLAMAYATASTIRIARNRKELGSLWRRALLLGCWYGFWVWLWFHVGLPLFDVPVDANHVTLTVLAVLGLLCAGIVGAIIGMLFRGGMPVMQLVAFTSYPFFFISGASWPREAMSVWLDRIGQLLPLRPWMLGSNRGVRMQATLQDVRPEVIHLLALSALYLFIALGIWWLSVRRLSIFRE